MAKTVQMAKMNVFGRQFTIVYKEGNDNPFYLYVHGWKDRGGEYMSKSRTLLARYANYESCLYHLLNLNLPEFRRES